MIIVLEFYQEACFSVSFSIQTWQAGKYATAVPEEDVDREDADARSEVLAQPNQLLLPLHMPLSLDCAFAASVSHF